MFSNVNLMTDVIESESLNAEEDVFAAKPIAMVNNGMAGLMIAIGHRAGSCHVEGVNCRTSM
jgi:hypothetical protein